MLYSGAPTSLHELFINWLLTSKIYSLGYRPRHMNTWGTVPTHGICRIRSIYSIVTNDKLDWPNRIKKVFCSKFLVCCGQVD